MTRQMAAAKVSPSTIHTSDRCSCRQGVYLLLEWTMRWCTPWLLESYRLMWVSVDLTNMCLPHMVLQTNITCAVKHI